MSGSEGYRRTPNFDCFEEQDPVGDPPVEQQQTGYGGYNPYD
jgi:hypothetical protein